MSSDLEIELPATLSALRPILTAIEDACTASNLGHGATTRILLAVEELISNTIKYGYAGESELPIRLRLRCAPHIELVYEDDAPEFDPIAWLDAAQRSAPGPPDRVGGRGIALVLGVARSSRYEQLTVGNRLTLRFD